MTTSPSRPRLSKRYAIAIAAAITALAVGISAPHLAGASTPNLSATDRVKAHPPPPLFSDTQIGTIARPIAAQKASATAAMAAWWRTHGTTPDDKAFTAWVQTQVPAPPPAATRRAELREVKNLDLQRTPTGIAAATWLELNGKKDVWKLYQHDQRELLSAKTGNADKADLKVILSLAKTAADALGTKYQQSAPYVLDPSLRPDHAVKQGQICPCSYPSRHAARAAGARTYLGYLSPHRLTDYQWMEDQVTFSRLYMAGHVQSDITAGSMLGDMIGQYVLVSRGHMPAPS